MDSTIIDLIGPHTGRIDQVGPAAAGTAPQHHCGHQRTRAGQAIADRPGGLLDEVEREGQINPHLLVSARQKPGDVEMLLAASTVWGRIDREALVLFARAQIRMH